MTVIVDGVSSQKLEEDLATALQHDFEKNLETYVQISKRKSAPKETTKQVVKRARIVTKAKRKPKAITSAKVQPRKAKMGTR